MLGSRQGGGLGSPWGGDVQWAEAPHAAGGAGMHDLLPMRAKAGQLAGPGVSSPVSPSPQQGQELGLRHQSPGLVDLG